MTNDSSSAISTCSVRFSAGAAQVDRRRRGGCGRRGTSARAAGRRWRAGPSLGSQGSMRIAARRPRGGGSCRRRAPRSACGQSLSAARALRSAARAPAVRARSGCAAAARGAGSPCGPRRGRRGNGLRGCGRRAWCRRRRRGCSALLAGSGATAHQTMYSSGHDRHLQDEHQPHEAPTWRHRRGRRPDARGPGAGDRRTRLLSQPRRRRRDSPPTDAPLSARSASGSSSSASSPQLLDALGDLVAVRRATRSVPNSSTLNDASAVP